MTNHTRHQEKIIKRYYDQRSEIAVQRLQELIGDLYLSEGKKRQQHWKNIALHLESLKVPQPTIDHLRQQDNPELVASLLQKLIEK
ncbi:MAG: hypothetical protein RIS70_3929 [Planctomycetota bacterium]|jgi:1,2-phenylacetyl-CoA epoxidase catalytic subunit